MTQLTLALDQFERVRVTVDSAIDFHSSAAERELKAMAEHSRRSLGQRVRWAEWRAAK